MAKALWRRVISLWYFPVGTPQNFGTHSKAPSVFGSYVASSTLYTREPFPVTRAVPLLEDHPRANMLLLKFVGLGDLGKLYARLSGNLPDSPAQSGRARARPVHPCWQIACLHVPTYATLPIRSVR